MSIPVGTVIDRYRVEGLLGEGGFGAVYLARHTMMDRPVALKVLHAQQGANPEVLERFIQEARAAAAIGSEHIVQVFDCGVTDDGQPFLAMERLEGEDLEGRLEKGPPPIDWTINVIQQTLAGLSAAHAAGIVHRDMKPANVFLCKTHQGDFVKLLDFGISKVRKPAGMGLTRTGVVMGTPHYMSPELFSGAANAGPAADIYAVGVMLYEALTERMPHDADTYEKLIVKVATQLPPALSDVAPHLPKGLTDIVMKCLHKDPEQRYQSASEVSRELSALDLSNIPTPSMRASIPAVAKPVSMADTLLPSQVEPAVQTPPTGPSRSISNEKKGFPVWIPVVGLLAVLGLGVGAFLALKPTADPPTPNVGVEQPDTEPNIAKMVSTEMTEINMTDTDTDTNTVEMVADAMTAQMTTKTGMSTNVNRRGLTDEQKALVSQGSAALKRRDRRGAEKIASQLLRSGAKAEGRYLRGQAGCVDKDLGAVRTALRQLSGSQKRRLSRYCKRVGFKY